MGKSFFKSVECLVMTFVMVMAVVSADVIPVFANELTTPDLLIQDTFEVDKQFDNTNVCHSDDPADIEGLKKCDESNEGITLTNENIYYNLLSEESIDTTNNNITTFSEEFVDDRIIDDSPTLYIDETESISLDKADVKYDIDEALKYAKAAQTMACNIFVANCLSQGGLSISAGGNVAGLRSNLLNSGMFEELRVPTSNIDQKNRRVKTIEKVQKGDVLIFSCKEQDPKPPHTALVTDVVDGYIKMTDRNTDINTFSRDVDYKCKCNTGPHSVSNGNIIIHVYHYTGKYAEEPDPVPNPDYDCEMSEGVDKVKEEKFVIVSAMSLNDKNKITKTKPYVMDIDGRDVVMVRSLNENTSIWKIYSEGNKFYSIKNLKRTDDKAYLSLEERDKKKKTNIHLGKWYDDDYESYWAFDEKWTGKFIIQNRYSGKCATISDGDSIKQLDFYGKKDDSVDKQTWLLVYPDKPTIKTKSLTAGKTGQAYKQTLTGTCDEWIEIEWKLASNSGKLPDGLSLSKDGTISGTPTKGGTFNIKVIAYNEFGETSKEYSLTIEGASSIPVTEVVLNKTSANLKIGGTETLTATVKPDNADDKTIKWSSSDTKVASVDESGKVTAVGIGTAEIYATNEASKVKGTCKVTVTKAEEDKDSFTVTFMSDEKVYETQSVKKGETAVAPKAPTKAGHRFDGWYDSAYKNKFDFATKITANTTLYAKWTNISGSIYTNNLTLVVGRKVNIKEECFPGLSTDVARYTISSSKLASQSKGMLKAKKTGSVEVIAQSSVNGGYEDVGICSITILSKPKLKFSVPMTYQGQTMEAAGFFTTTDTIPSQVTMWESSKPNVIRVANEKTGTLEAVGNGSAKITAYFGQKGVAGTVKVSATLKVKVPKFAKTEYKIKAGAKKVMPVKNVVAAQNPQFRIDNPAVATVEPQINKKGNPTGKAIVRGVSAGDATLTAIIDGREYTCTIHITGSK